VRETGEDDANVVGCRTLRHESDDAVRADDAVGVSRERKERDADRGERGFAGDGELLV